jgi:uncharacterized protein YjbJ (UPF0337 family)
MDKNRIVGMGRKVKGTIKAATGKAIGDKKMEAEGNAEKAVGTVQNTVGGVKDGVKDALDC